MEINLHIIEAKVIFNFQIHTKIIVKQPRLLMNKHTDKKIIKLL